MRKNALATTFVILAAATPALASDDDSCTKAPKEQWLTVDQLKTKLGEQGYTVDKIKMEDDCAEAKVKDKDGKTTELYLDPATGNRAKKDD